MQLSLAVIALLQQGRKIEAIKLLREERHIGLKEAKDIVDEYCLQHPELIPASHSGKSFSTILSIVVAIALIVYWFTHQ